MEGVSDWVSYWRDAQRPVEAMRAHFEEHVFHPHSHEAYSFGLTETGAQRFVCRGGSHTSAAGLVMAFNPDDPHDGESATELGFTYRMVHIGPDVVREVLADVGGPGRAAALPLFADPVHRDPPLWRALLGLHAALTEGAGPLVRDERLTAAVAAMVRRAATAPPPARTLRPGGARSAAARRARALLAERYAEEVPAAELAAAAGCSRYALYRAFRAEYGMSPSDLQRLLRLRDARRRLTAGASGAEAAAAAGFADQSHLHRWFVRSYGITPGEFALAGRGR
ncbi:AraC family ligand binding domain-containing protein [Streptomyces sp. MAR4 CNX-425]|uniref:AraC family ligand binding domain-containing protein n=1 Tax=Streptomyces sp. MAR4 CNX-425 TaxID=3406343 RepID=UPI003B5050A4